ncbi:hypothetical protein Tco_1035731 [Tanacetum coccineum]
MDNIKNRNICDLCCYSRHLKSIVRAADKNEANLGVKPLVTTNEQPSVEATHKDEAPVVILTRAFRSVDKATLAFGKAHCKVPWTNERSLENRELNAIIGVWFTLW